MVESAIAVGKQPAAVEAVRRPESLAKWMNVHALQTGDGAVGLGESLRSLEFDLLRSVAKLGREHDGTKKG